MSHSQNLKPLQNQHKSVLTQIEMSHSQNLKPLIILSSTINHKQKDRI
ncbi:hypothetical protein [Merismopedia glauca]|nr:hypothetical protein [Merismopedia glauca]